MSKQSKEKTLTQLADAFANISSWFNVVGEHIAVLKGQESAPVEMEPVTPAPTATKKDKAVQGKTGSASTDLSIDTLREKFQELIALAGKQPLIDILENHGAGTLADLETTQYRVVLNEIESAIADAESGDDTGTEEEDAEEDTKVSARKSAKSATTKPASKVTLKALQARAAELNKLNKAEYSEIVQLHGKPSEADPADYAAYMEALDTVLDNMVTDEDVEAAEKTRTKRKPKAITAAQLEELARDLVALDKTAYLKLARKYGKPKEAEAADYPEYLSALTEAISVAEELAADEDDDDLV